MLLNSLKEPSLHEIDVTRSLRSLILKSERIGDLSMCLGGVTVKYTWPVRTRLQTKKKKILRWSSWISRNIWRAVRKEARHAELRIARIQLFMPVDGDIYNRITEWVVKFELGTCSSLRQTCGVSVGLRWFLYGTTGFPALNKAVSGKKRSVRAVALGRYLEVTERCSEWSFQDLDQVVIKVVIAV